jgi:hypothetical protein
VNLAQSLYRAYHYFLRGEPFPSDLQMELTLQHIDPAELEERFTDGTIPEGAELIDPEDDPEDTDYCKCGGIQELLDLLRKQNTILTKFFKERE